MRNRIGNLLALAKDGLGVRTEMDVHRRTGIPYAVLSHWKKGDVDPLDSKLRNVAILRGPLGMTLDEIYDYLETGKPPKKGDALANPAIVRAYDSLVALVTQFSLDIGYDSGCIPKKTMNPITNAFDNALEGSSRAALDAINTHLEGKALARALEAYTTGIYSMRSVEDIAAAIGQELPEPLHVPTFLAMLPKGAGPRGASISVSPPSTV